MGIAVRTIGVLLLSTMLFGCNRGCTTSKSIDKESQTLNLHGEEVEIYCKLIQFTHSRRRPGGGLLNRERSYSHGLSFGVKTPWGRIDEFYSERITDPGETDLEAHLSRIKVKLTEDKNHLGFGVDDRALGRRHIYKDIMFSNPTESYGVNGEVAWSDLNLSAEGTSAEVFYKLLRSNTIFTTVHNHSLLDVLKQLPVEDEAYTILIETYPTSNLLAEALKDEVILGKYRSNARLHEQALEQLKKIVLSNDREIHVASKRETYDAIRNLEGENATQVLDEINLVLITQERDADVAAQYFSDRFSDASESVPYATRQALLEKVRLAMERHIKGEAKYHHLSIRAAIDLLVLLDEEPAVIQFFEDAIAAGELQERPDDFADGLTRNDKRLTAYTYQQLLYMIWDGMEAYSDFDRRAVYRKIGDEISCDKLKATFEKYADTFRGTWLPDKCEEI